MQALDVRPFFFVSFIVLGLLADFFARLASLSLFAFFLLASGFPCAGGSQSGHVSIFEAIK